MRRRVLIVAAALALGAGGVAATTASSQDEDRPIDPRRADARQAVASALNVVPGDVRGVTFDVDDDKWEIMIAQGGREYEVELTPGDYRLLRLDYDFD